MRNDPAAVEMESYVLGAMIQSEVATTTALDQLRVDDFVRPDHRLVFSALDQMRTKNEPVDGVTLAAWLRGSGDLESVGGTIAILGLDCPAVANHKAYIRGVRDQAMLRELHTTGQQITEATTQNAGDALTEATAKLVELRGRLDGRMRQRRVDAESMAEDFCTDYQADQLSGGGDVVWFPRHLPRLNNWSMGQRPGRLVVSGGLTGHGKSWFGLDCSDAALEMGERVAYFALELPASEITERLVAMQGIDYSQIQQREAVYDDMHQAIQHVANWGDRLHVFDGTTPLSRIEAEIVGAFVSRRPYRYVVIDTINLIDQGSTPNLRQAIDKTMLRLKQITIDYGCTIHIQAQMNRDKRRDAMDPPTLADLKESSGIEQAADLVLFIHRFPSGTDEELSDRGLLVVAKGRNIKRRGRIYVDFDQHGMRFVQSRHQGEVFMAGMPKGDAA